MIRIESPFDVTRDRATRFAELGQIRRAEKREPRSERSKINLVVRRGPNVR